LFRSRGRDWRRNKRKKELFLDCGNCIVGVGGFVGCVFEEGEGEGFLWGQRVD